MRFFLQRLPDNNNFYATFKDISKAQIKEVFMTHGWQIRKSGWHDFELMNAWSELMLEGEEKEPLLNGVVIYTEIYVEILSSLLENTAGRCNYEFYSSDRNVLLKQINNY